MPDVVLVQVGYPDAVKYAFEFIAGLWFPVVYGGVEPVLCVLEEAALVIGFVFLVVEEVGSGVVSIFYGAQYVLA